MVRNICQSIWKLTTSYLLLCDILCTKCTRLFEQTFYSHDGYGIYFNIVDLCGILPYKRMYPYKCGIKINFDILTTQKDQ